MKKTKLALAGLALGSAVLLSACGGGGGGDSGSTPKATTDVTIPLSPSNGATTATAFLVGKTFNFNAGVPAFGTATPTTVTLTGSAANPNFTITAGSIQASGTMAYGSCDFTVTTSNETNPSAPLYPGKTFKVTPCTVTATTTGNAADGTLNTVQTAWFLGTASAGNTASVAVAPNGEVRVNGVLVATITISATGATGGN